MIMTRREGWSPNMPAMVGRPGDPPVITDVRVESRPNVDYGQVWDRGGPTEWVVTPVWSSVNRPVTFAWVVGNARVASRLRHAVLAGVVLTNPKIVTDTAGQTYVTHDTKVFARRASADLTRLGF
jgi:hypothetical protein